MQTRSFRGSGEPARVNASSNARVGLGPDPRRALGPAAIRAASTGRTHDRTRPMLHQRKKALVNQAPSTHDPQQTCATLRRGSFCPVLALFFTAVALADAHADMTVRFFSRNAIAFGSMISIS